MQILKVVQAYYPFCEAGGPVFKVRALARRLSGRGHDVTVLTADLGLRGRNGFRSKVEPSRWGWRAEEDQVEAIYLTTVGRYRALSLNPRVASYCRTSLRKFDLVHFYGLYDLLGPPVSYFCRRRGIPYVIEPMGMYRPIDRSFRLKAIWHWSLGGVFCRGAARIVATSDMERQGLMREGIPAEKLVIRYNGVDSELYNSPLPRGSFRSKCRIASPEPLVLFLSRLIPRKGADILIEAFADACPSTGRLVIAGPEGESGYRGFLERRARESGIEARVLFVGPLYDEEKKAALTDADVFVLPSRYENFANVAAEAMACGVPVIISDACGISSLVEDRAGLVIAPQKEPLANALRKLIDNKALHARLKQGCREVVQELSWDRLTEKMEDYYAEVLAGNARSSQPTAGRNKQLGPGRDMSG